MKTLLLSLCLVLASLAQAQKTVKYKGLTLPVGAYWEIAQNDDDYLQLKMKGEEIFFYAKYLGQDKKNEDLTKETLMFLISTGLIDPDALLAGKQDQIAIGNQGIASHMNWTDNGGKREWHSYMTKFDVKKKGSHSFILIFKDECTRGTGKYWAHREDFEKKIKFKPAK